MVDEHSLDRQYANFHDGCIEDAAQRVEETRHVPQLRQPEICPKCGGTGFGEYLGVVCVSSRCTLCHGAGQLPAGG
jgi:DnaJ-class molecular chaperone